MTAPFSHAAAFGQAPGPGVAAFRPGPDFVPPVQTRRDRLWELSSSLHCSIVGTCLSTADLRALLAKLGDPAARTASEHDLHGQAVSRAARRDEGGKLLHKLLDRRHEREVARFARAETTDDVRALWRDAVARGEIPGAYWAVLSHPATDRALVQEAFGDVHMLSHLVGRAVRADLSRLVELEAELAAQADRLAEQDARIRTLTDEKVALVRDRDARRDAGAGPRGPEPARIGETGRDEAGLAILAERLRRADAHADAAEARRAEAERVLKALAEDVRQGAEREAALRQDLAELESALSDHLTDAAPVPAPALDGLSILYVGGRPRQVAQARLLVARRGGRLLAHDGGVEDQPALLPGLVGQAAAVLLPVDCVSHDAAGTVKRICRDRGIAFLPLRSASLAALAGALRTLRPAAAA